MRRYSTFGVTFSISVLLGGCTVGPKYVKPTVPVTPEFKEQPPDSFKESDIWKRAQPSAQRHDRCLGPDEVMGKNGGRAVDPEIADDNEHAGKNAPKKGRYK